MKSLVVVVVVIMMVLVGRSGCTPLLPLGSWGVLRKQHSRRDGRGEQSRHPAPTYPHAPRVC